ncbi:hypothetical protein RSSM_04628 [Rhodopirellula sallentina SM41]|uniref:Uncharacterized protein n=1 Tax=Rhodopirellula sallentina SM41 TaxID=1263870 RepID=M5TXI5_9BACT|nr:hypothetical protein RSSM_04628 [Rhodopirellula sallentina SM41]
MKLRQRWEVWKVTAHNAPIPNTSIQATRSRGQCIDAGGDARILFESDHRCHRHLRAISY